jgi:hypothetical protein
MGKAPGTVGILLYNMTVADHLIFIDNHTFQTDRAAGVNLAGTDSHFSAKSVTEAASKLHLQ